MQVSESFDGVTNELVKQMEKNQTAKKPEPKRMVLDSQQAPRARGYCC
jgi:hypothetical protein